MLWRLLPNFSALVLTVEVMLLVLTYLLTLLVALEPINAVVDREFAPSKLGN